MIENDYNVYLNPYKIEVEKFVELKLHTIILRPSVSSRTPKEKPNQDRKNTCWSIYGNEKD